jgi:hypothetical protein
LTLVNNIEETATAQFSSKFEGRLDPKILGIPKLTGKLDSILL